MPCCHDLELLRLVYRGCELSLAASESDNANAGPCPQSQGVRIDRPSVVEAMDKAWYVSPRWCAAQQARMLGGYCSKQQ